jgi:hypothetical protein
MKPSLKRTAWKTPYPGNMSIIPLRPCEYAFIGP